MHFVAVRDSRLRGVEATFAAREPMLGHGGDRLRELAGHRMDDGLLLGVTSLPRLVVCAV